MSPAFVWINKVINCHANLLFSVMLLWLLQLLLYYCVVVQLYCNVVIVLCMLVSYVAAFLHQARTVLSSYAIVGRLT